MKQLKTCQRDRLVIVAAAVGIREFGAIAVRFRCLLQMPAKAYLVYRQAIL